MQRPGLRSANVRQSAFYLSGFGWNTQPNWPFHYSWVKAFEIEHSSQLQGLVHHYLLHKTWEMEKEKNTDHQQKSSWHFSWPVVDIALNSLPRSWLFCWVSRSLKPAVVQTRHAHSPTAWSWVVQGVHVNQNHEGWTNWDLVKNIKKFYILKCL